MRLTRTVPKSSSTRPSTKLLLRQAAVRRFLIGTAITDGSIDGDTESSGMCCADYLVLDVVTMGVICDHRPPRVPPHIPAAGTLGNIV